MLLLIASVGLTLTAAVCASTTKADDLTVLAVSEDTGVANSAIKELRAMGPGGLDRLLTTYSAEAERYGNTGESDDRWKRVANAIDTVAMQKDAYASGLYWYTDIEEAKRAAKEQHKPILSLRLLGNLNEEFSCANSRLFRAILYANVDVSAYLRDNYILHWKSVRPAPRITIDFGDGRKIERTITGNSIHYLLDEDGNVIDAIPGLYSPVAFLRYIQQGAELNRSLASIAASARQLTIMRFRKGNFDAVVRRRAQTVTRAGVQMTDTKTGSIAILAAPLAVTKAGPVGEYAILRVYDDFTKFEPSIKFDDWNKLAATFSPELGVDNNTVRFIHRQLVKNGLTQEELEKLLTKLFSFVALDTTRNEFLFHTKLYQWLNEARHAESLDALNSRVYDQIFQTPNSDPWLGLYSNDVYAALDGNGILK